MEREQITQIGTQSTYSVQYVLVNRYSYRIPFQQWECSRVQTTKRTLSPMEKNNNNKIEFPFENLFHSLSEWLDWKLNISWSTSHISQSNLTECECEFSISTRCERYSLKTLAHYILSWVYAEPKVEIISVFSMYMKRKRRNRKKTTKAPRVFDPFLIVNFLPLWHKTQKVVIRA